MDALPKPSAWIYGELAPGKALTFAKPQMTRTAGPDGVTPIYTADDLRLHGESCARMAREEVIAALQEQIDHCAMNGLRLAPSFGQSKGAPAITASYIEAVIERFRKGLVTSP